MGKSETQDIRGIKMGRMKETLTEFCEIIYPEDFDRQDKLFQDMIRATGDPLENPTVASFRRAYESTGECPMISLEDMANLVKNCTSDKL